MNITSDIINSEIDWKNSGVDAPALKRIRSTAALELALRCGSDTTPGVIERAEAFLKFIS